MLQKQEKELKSAPFLLAPTGIEPSNAYTPFTLARDQRLHAILSRGESDEKKVTQFNRLCQQISPSHGTLSVTLNEVEMEFAEVEALSAAFQSEPLGVEPTSGSVTMP